MVILKCNNKKTIVDVNDDFRGVLLFPPLLFYWLAALIKKVHS